jgi:ERCC4-type nuclease
MFVSPSEHKLSHIGVVSTIPEQYGVDFFWESKLGSVGVQRKAFPGDFIASTQDGRLVEEYARMQDLDIRVLLLEGRASFVSGALVHDYGRRWTKEQLWNYLMSVQIFKGVHIATTDSIYETEQWLESFRNWTNKDDHFALDYRPHTDDIEYREPNTSGPEWANIRNRSYQSYFLQSLPNTGPKKACAIIDDVGFPFKLAVPDEELLAISGIGEKWLTKVKEVLDL